MRGERDRRGRTQGRGRVGPRAVEQLVDRARAGGERVEQRALALEAVRDVLGELGGRVVDERAVAGADQHRPALAQALEPGEVAGERARVRRDEDAAGAEDGVAGEGHRARAGREQVREVVGRVARRRDRLERADARAVG